MVEKCSRVGVHMHINTYGCGVFFLYFFSRKEYMAGFNNCTSLAYTVSGDFVGGFREVSAQQQAADVQFYECIISCIKSTICISSCNHQPLVEVGTWSANVSTTVEI